MIAIRFSAHRLSGGVFALLLSFPDIKAPAQDAISPPAGTQEIVVVGRAEDLLGSASTSSEGTIGANELADRPISRRGEILETVPGVIVTQHSGEGKANQYFLRGFNLDHGTDFALSVDDMPINLRTHAHGQGYADLNFIIPELIERIDYSKGPFIAEVGDFSAAGAAQLHLFRDLRQGLALAGIGQDNFYRLVLGDTFQTKGGALTAAFEFGHYDGPFVVNQNSNRYNGYLSYNWDTRESQYNLTVMAYHGHFHSPDQVAQRAIEEGLIPRLGTLDPTDGGISDRDSLSFDWRHNDGTSNTHLNLYSFYYGLDLYSNFTYFLDDPLNGDQFHQKDRRFVSGGTLERTWTTGFLGRDVTQTIGLQVRNDYIPQVGLFHTKKTNNLSTIRDDLVEQASIGIFQRNEIRWTPWFRTIFGLRADLYYFHVDSNLAANSGDVFDGIVSPKLNLIFGPWAETEFYLNAGTGFHSNDARGTTSTISPVSGEKTPRADPLVRSTSIEVGARTSMIPNLISTVSFYYLTLDSELVFTGDAGETEASAASRRLGVEFANFYQPFPWLTLDADFAYTYARFKDNPTGDRIPNSIATVLACGVTVDAPSGAYGSLRARYFGPQPLIEDNRAIGPSSLTFDARIGWKFKNFEVALDVLNLFDAENNDIAYFYTSRLRGEPAEGVDDFHIHPAEPRAFRFSATYRF
jgi:hypothetical protein